VRGISLFPIFAALTIGLAAHAQERLTFDVASVRASQPGATSARLQRDPRGNFSASNQTLRALITLAYGVQSLQIVGAPDWIAVEPWDVVARAGRDLPPQPPGQPAPDLLMLRALLEDRFRLVARRDTRELPIYALMQARNDGRLGLRRASGDACCGVRGDGMSGANASFRGESASMTEFARTLSGQVQRIVVDRTGLTGQWDFDLRFTPPRFATTPSAALTDSPSIFTALQEQLGLRLEATTGPVEVLVIERVERPSEN
jgi:uncharacterized protein (TIGR03435 family)